MYPHTYIPIRKFKVYNRIESFRPAFLKQKGLLDQEALSVRVRSN